MTLNYFTAFAAGLLSFLSPCVLPLVPAYLCYLAGSSFEELSQGIQPPKMRRHVLLAALLFVAGFSTVFILLGASASTAGQALRSYQDILSKIAGAAIVLMGLHFLGIFRFATLNMEKRISFPTGTGPLSAYAMGLAFAFGWTPCIGPVLAAILTAAAREETLHAGIGLLISYSLGLGLPFIAAGIAFPVFLRISERMKKYLRWFETIAGAGLVITGFLFLTDQFTRIAGWMIEAFPVLARLG